MRSSCGDDQPELAMRGEKEGEDQPELATLGEKESCREAALASEMDAVRVT